MVSALMKTRRPVPALIEGGTAYEDTPVFDMHRGRLDAMQQRLRADPAHVHNRFGSPAEDIYPVGGSFG